MNADFHFDFAVAIAIAIVIDGLAALMQQMQIKPVDTVSAQLMRRAEYLELLAASWAQAYDDAHFEDMFIGTLPPGPSAGSPGPNGGGTALTVRYPPRPLGGRPFPPRFLRMC